jgi:hypothetical protein
MKEIPMSEASQGSDEGYQATPIVEPWGDSGWRAGVLLSGDGGRGNGSAKSLGEQLFASREDAWEFAETQYGSLGRD